MTTLVLEYEKYKVLIKHYQSPFSGTQKQKQLSMKGTLMIYFNQSVVLLYLTCKNLYEHIQFRLLI